jgi:hypothetical protein
MNAFCTECLDIVNKNLFAIQKLYDMNKVISVYECDEDWIKVFIESEFERTILPNKMSLGIKEFYSSIFKMDFRGEVYIDCNYDYNKDRFELYISKLVQDQGKRYILKIDEDNYRRNCRWELTLRDEDLEKVKYLKEISEESIKRFGNSNSLDLFLNVTDKFIPENNRHYTTPFEIDNSQLLYVGNNKFVVICKFTSCWDGETIKTEEFEI